MGDWIPACAGMTKGGRNAEVLERMKGAMLKVREETEDPFLDAEFVEKIGRL